MTATETEMFDVTAVNPIASVTVQTHTAVFVWGAVPEAVHVTEEAVLLLMLIVASPLDWLQA